MPPTPPRLIAFLLSASLLTALSCGGEVIPAPPQVYRQGSLSMATSVLNAFSELSVLNTADASFTEFTRSPGPTNSATLINCARTTEGACQLTVCDLVPPAGDGSGGISPTRLDAGAITFTGGTVSPVTLTFQDGYHRSIELPADKPLLAGGEDVTVTVAGSGEVPAFTSTLRAPQALTVEGWPVLGGLDTKVSLDTTMPLSVSLSGGAEGQVFMNLQSQSATQLASVQCRADATTAGFTVSPATLAQLKAVSPDVGLSLSTHSQQSVKVDDWTIVFYLGVPLRDGQGQYITASGYAVFQ